MFSKKKKSVQTPLHKPKQLWASELTSLIEKLQRNGDKVEKNIQETEQNLNKDVANINEGKPPVYQDSTNKTILNSLVLLDDLDIAVARAKQLQHPQAEMIKHDMKQLRERVLKVLEDHKQMYRSQIDWSRMIDEKLVNLENKGFGQDLPSIEKEVDEHKIFHSQVENLAFHIGQEYQYLQLKYNTLVARSSDRQKNLLSFRDYMRRCTAELTWLNQQIEEHIMYDWSDANLDYATRKRQYEDFKSNNLLPKEGTIDKLREEEEKLIAQGHPAQHVIEAHMDAVRIKWEQYLNLLLCEEDHLENMEEFHKFQKDVQDTRDLLERKDNEINQKNNSGFIEQEQLESSFTDLNEQAKAMDDIDDRIKTLKKCSLEVLPLQYRRCPPQKVLRIKALCDFDTDQGQVQRGEVYTLMKNNGTKWDVKDPAGQVMMAPGVCFMIPPPDPESVAAAESLRSFQNDIMQKLVSTREALQSSLTNLKKGGTQADDEQNLPYTQLMALLDQVVKNLDMQNQPMVTDYNRLQDMKSILDTISFGDDVETIRQKLEDHTNFHKEVESLAPRITQDKNNSNDLQMDYNNLLESSKSRQKNLLSLKDYVERCDKELTLLSQETNERIKYDWSNIDHQNRLQQYENFVTNIKGAINSKIDGLQTDGHELINHGHPGQNTIQAYINEVNRCWQELLVILKCEEAHLTNIGQHHQFQAEFTEIENLLKQQESKLKDIKEVKEIKNDEDEYRLYRALTIMTDVEKTVEDSENRIKRLQQLSLQFTSLSDHRTPPKKDQSVMALCDVTTETAKIVEGNRYTLMSINDQLWDVKDSAGNIMTAPALYFSVAEQTISLTDRVETLESQWKSINDQIPEIKEKLTSQRVNLRKDKTGVYTEPEIMKGKICAVKMDIEIICNFCKREQKKFNMKESKYKCENNKCKFRQDSHKFVNIDGFIVMKVNNKNITKKVPTLVVKGYLKENNLEHLLEDNCQLEEHFMEDPGFEIMYDKFEENNKSSAANDPVTSGEENNKPQKPINKITAAFQNASGVVQ